LQDAPRILLLEADAAIASRLAVHLEKAGADVITADHALQAMQRLAQFTFSGAILDYWDGADDRSRIAERLLQLSVPVVVHAHVEPPTSWCAPHFADPDAIIAAVMRLVQAPRTP
jgi:CheY-like chemotaxis protein